MGLIRPSLEVLIVEINSECRRHSTRRRTLKSGRIVFNNRNSTIECVVRNLSSHGALLQLPNVTGIPDDFELYIDGEAKCHAATTIWKRDGKMGVEFGLTPSARIKVLTEAGFRCGLPTCRDILAVDLHPLIQIDEDGAEDASNFIAVCPNCYEAHRRGTITTEALHTYKSILVALSSAFDVRTIDLLLFLVGVPRDALIVSGDGVLAFAGLAAAGYAEVRMTANNGKLLIKYAVNITPKGRLLVDAWKTGTPPTVREAQVDFSARRSRGRLKS
jgi:hypothetical protein